MNLKFGNDSADTGSFKLLELPPDLCKLVEQSLESNTTATWTIKGQTNDDAVLCTTNKTYAIRSIVLSNSVLVVTRPDDASTVGSGWEQEDVVIRDTLHEVLELVPSVPRLQVLNGLLRGREYDEGHEDEDMEDSQEGDAEEGRPTKRRKFTYDDARASLQASEMELDRGLRERRVLVLDGELRPIAPTHLTTVLELLLNYLVSLSLPHSAAPVTDLTLALEDDHEIKPKVTTQVMAWFGQVDDGLWSLNVNAVVKEIGLGILRAYKWWQDDPIPESVFVSKWKTAVGDTFEESVSLDLLLGNYLSQPSIDAFASSEPTLAYFPSSTLPTEPVARFADLFLTRTRWKADDIAPFLSEICVDNKERDKLLLKHARAITDAEGVWYTARMK
ncbi:hypothetical protein EUX98_g1901 [Antrodiella citrinella]|uniref:Sister chromatid cohesion protein DCC1 n=1 Tax=Antrodiella citrinella TaxID=2447956 RepID=A0A4S4N2M1_9APHY|nr:hypothetical protein EUX98_g1901 [Antrodiella citrinella]